MSVQWLLFTALVHLRQPVDVNVNVRVFAGKVGEW